MWGRRETAVPELGFHGGTGVFPVRNWRREATSERECLTELGSSGASNSTCLRPHSGSSSQTYPVLHVAHLPTCPPGPPSNFLSCLSLVTPSQDGFRLLGLAGFFPWAPIPPPPSAPISSFPADHCATLCFSLPDFSTVWPERSY